MKGQFNERSKAIKCQLNLQHGTKNTQKCKTKNSN